MSGWNGYLRSVIACCLCCEIVMQIASETKAKDLIRMVCAMVILLTVLNPLTEMDLHTALRLPETEWIQADEYIAEGKSAAEEATAVCIEQTCETYIQEKATSLGSSMEGVSVTLNDDLLPVFVQIRGRGDTGTRETLQELLMRDLGIPKEQQAWIWNQENSSPAS